MIKKDIPLSKKNIIDGNISISICPSCKRPTFFIKEKSYFECLTCGIRGGLIEYIKYMKKDISEKKIIDCLMKGDINESLYHEAINNNLQKAKRYKKMNSDALNFFESQNNNKGIKYLKEVRKLSDETIKKFHLGYADNNWRSLVEYMTKLGYSPEELVDNSLAFKSSKGGEVFDFFNDRAMFPFVNKEGEILGFGGRTLNNKDDRKYLNSKETVVYSKRKYLFDLYHLKADNNKPVILVEGNLDVISLNQAGFENAVASCGTALTEEQAKLIREKTSSVIICYDDDDAGQAATEKSIPILRDAGLEVYVISVNESKDPDEFINKFGSEAFQELIDNATPAIDYQTLKYQEKYSEETFIKRILDCHYSDEELIKCFAKYNI